MRGYKNLFIFGLLSFKLRCQRVKYIPKIKVIATAKRGQYQMNNSSHNTSEVVKRFDRVYLGDSLIQQIKIDILSARMIFLCSSALLIRDVQNPNIFAPEGRYQPAYLTFYEVNYFLCPEGNFYLNNTIVDFNAKPANQEDMTEFDLKMTGGFDNESFIRSFIIVAGDFSLTEVK